MSTKDLLIVAPGGMEGNVDADADADASSGAVDGEARNNPEEGCIFVVE